LACAGGFAGTPHGHDLSEDPQLVVGRDDDRTEVTVFRSKLDSRTAYVQSLHGGFVVEQRHDNVAALGDGLLAYDDHVPVGDSCVHHAVARDAQRKTPAGPGEPSFDQYFADDILFREHRAPCHDSANQGNRHEVEWRVVGFADNAQAARFARLALDVALPDELTDLSMGAGAGDAQDFGEFLNRWRELMAGEESLNLEKGKALGVRQTGDWSSAPPFVLHVIVLDGHA
jgi:hypothetical protein